MATCVHCGRELPRFVFGNAAELCKDCLARSAAEQRPSPPTRVIRARPSSGFADFPVTYFLLGLNVLVYLAMVLTGASPTEPSIPVLLRWGADFGPLTLGGQPWRLVTSAFVHAGILHIGFNMWCFWQLGQMSERIFGRLQYFLIYIFTGIASSLLTTLVHPVEVSVGASGAIFGICGALIPALYFGRLPIPALAIRATLRSLVLFVVFNLILGASIAHVDNFAHVGGLIFGLLSGLLLSRTLILAPDTRRNLQSLAFIVLAALLFGGWRFVEKTDSFVVPYNRGLDAVEKHDFATAAREFSAAVALRPDFAELHYVLAHAYMEQGQFAKAVPELNQTLAKKPNEARAQFDLCVAEFNLQQYQAALSACVAASRADPDNASALLNAGATLIQLKRYDDAIRLLEPLARKAPDMIQLQQDLGVAYFAVGRYQDSIAAYQKALSRQPKNADAQQGLARAQAALQNKK